MAAGSAVSLYMLGFRDFVMAGKFAHLENSDAAT
jgi:hypothetical protein